MPPTDPIPEFDDLPDRPARTALAPAIPCGHYEVDEPGGSTVHVRVRRRHAGPHADRWVVEWLLGSDGRTWEPFAAVLPDRLDIWPRYRKTDYGTVAGLLFEHLRGGGCFDGWEFRLVKPCCARCGRELKLGPDGDAGVHARCRLKWEADRP